MITIKELQLDNETALKLIKLIKKEEPEIWKVLKVELTEALNIDDVSKRCFIVFYVGTVKDTNGQATGYIEFTSGDYLNKVKTIEQILLVNKNKIKNIAITNIIELSQKDYKTWND